MHIVCFRYSFEDSMGVRGLRPAVGKIVEYFYKNNALFCHNFGNLRKGKGPVHPRLRNEAKVRALKASEATDLKRRSSRTSSKPIICLGLHHCHS